MRWWRVNFVAALLLSTAFVLNLYSHGTSVTTRRPLTGFPVKIGVWAGQDIKLDARILGILKADQLLSRQYATADKPPLYLFIAYYETQKQGETIHSPKNCMPGAGWEPIESGYTTLTDERGRSLIVNRYLVEKGVNRQLVFYWYQMHGRAVASEYKGKMYLVWDAIRHNRTDGAVVRVSVPVTGEEPSAELVAKEFIRQISPLLHEYMPD
jgi:EpsI family protein